jgi:hypothetical protein
MTRDLREICEVSCDVNDFRLRPDGFWCLINKLNIRVWERVQIQSVRRYVYGF